MVYKHNAILHNKNRNDTVSKTENASDSPESSNNNNMPVSLSAVSSGQILLCTALIEVVNALINSTYLARTFQGTGSQTSFITENLEQKLNLQSRLDKR